MVESFRLGTNICLCKAVDFVEFTGARNPGPYWLLLNMRPVQAAN
jgi:hypothetical protein